MTPPDEVSLPQATGCAATRGAPADALWYKDVIIYQLHVKAFFDADDDGINIRIITDLAINHTLDQHPWFQRARRARPGCTAIFISDG